MQARTETVSCADGEASAAQRLGIASDVPPYPGTEPACQIVVQIYNVRERDLGAASRAGLDRRSVNSRSASPPAAFCLDVALQVEQAIFAVLHELAEPLFEG